MTVAELHKLLSKYDDSAPVIIETATNSGTPDEPDPDDIEFHPIRSVTVWSGFKAVCIRCFRDTQTDPRKAKG